MMCLLHGASSTGIIRMVFFLQGICLYFMH